MKVILILDKKGRFDGFVYPGANIPPFIPPEKRDEPKDGGPPEPEKKEPQPS